MYVLYIVVCPFVLFLLAIVLSVLLLFMASDYSFGIFKLFLLLFSCICMFCTSLFVLLYFFFWPLFCLSFYLWLLITPLVSSNFSCYSLVLYVCFVHRCLSFCTFSFGHCFVCSSSIYGF